MMSLMNKTTVTDNLAYIIGNQSVEVMATEHYPYEIKVGFVNAETPKLDQELLDKLFEDEYALVIYIKDKKAANRKRDAYRINEVELAEEIKYLQELKKFVQFVKQNKQNIFDTALFDGILADKVLV